MITALSPFSPTPIRAPYEPIPASAPTVAPVDLATLGLASDAPSARPSYLGILAGALALAIAAPVLIHVAHDAPGMVPAVTVAAVAAQQAANACQGPDGVLSIEQQDAFAHAATPRAHDNATATEIRGRVRQVTEQVAQDVSAFRDGVQRLQQADAAAPTSDSLEETATTQTLKSGSVTRTLHRTAHDGFQAGDFEVVRTEGTRRQSHVVLSGSTIRVEVQENISGFAGNIRKNLREEMTVPAMGIEVYPSVDLRYQSSTRSLSHPINRESLQTREVEVYSDGSTRVRSGDGGALQEQSEPPAAGRLVPGQTLG